MHGSRQGRVRIHSRLTAAAFCLACLAGAATPREPEAVYTDVRADKGTTTVTARFGETLRIEWQETAAAPTATADDKPEPALAWPTSRRFGLYWKSARWWLKDANWLGTHATCNTGWIRVDFGGEVDGIWNGRLLTTARFVNEDYSIADFFWEYRQRSDGPRLGLVHARFMRNRVDDFLYCRLNLVDPWRKPVRIVLASAPHQQHHLPDIYENVLYTPGGRQVVFRRVMTHTVSRPIESVDVATSAPLVLSRGMDLLYGGAGLIYLPEQIESIRSPADPVLMTLDMTLKPDVETVHLGFWEYAECNAAGALKRLEAGHDLATQTLRSQDWQTTIATEVIDLEFLERRFERLLAIRFEDTEADDPLQDADAALERETEDARIRERLSALREFMASHPVITDSETLLALSETRDILERIESERQKWVVEQIGKGKRPASRR